MPKRIRVSLANKCQMLFGIGVVLIVVAALAVVSKRMNHLAELGPRQRAHDLAQLWLEEKISFGTEMTPVDVGLVAGPGALVIEISIIENTAFELEAEQDPFLANAIERFEGVEDSMEMFERAKDEEGDTFYRYARAVRMSDLDALVTSNEETPLTDAQGDAIENTLERVLLINLVDQQAQRDHTINLIYLIAAGLVAGLFAIAAFWYITTRLILSPVRVLRGYAEKVSQGNFNIRSDINTGDEFEQLSDMFNTMLDNVRSTQNRLTSANQSLDLKLGELAESNVALYEANKIKGEFLANVSHELRTPLNSIIGFAEVLQETLAERTGPIDEKRKRYTGNIILSSRRLLDLINDLLDLAKIEAGRAEVRLSTVSIKDTAEGLANLIRPQAENRGLNIRIKTQPNLPQAETDPGKLQQVLFNFLANAIKFSPEGGEVLLAASLEESSSPQTPALLRLSVSDHGPGIAPEDHKRVFEKFSQLDSMMTREVGGTGLGLTICTELAQMLGGRIELDSDVGRGATFTLIIPVIYQPPVSPLMPE